MTNALVRLFKQKRERKRLATCYAGKAMSLTLVLNGQSKIFASLGSSSKLDQLITELELQEDRVAVEHNGVIVPRADWAQTVLSTGDRLEVVHFVGGGNNLPFQCS